MNKAAVVLALLLECQYQLLIVQRRLLRKKQGGVTQTLLLFGWKKLLVKVYHHHKPVDHRSLPVLIILPLLLHSWSLCICKWRGSYSLSLLFFSVPKPRMSYCGIPLRPELPRIAYERLQIHQSQPKPIKIQLRYLRMHYEPFTNQLDEIL